MPPEIVPLSTDNAAETLASAFVADEDYQQTFWPQGRMDPARARLLFGVQVLGAEVLRAPALGVAPKAAPEGVITYHATHHGVTWNPFPSFRLVKLMCVCYLFVPFAVLSRINRYSRWIYANTPKSPHFFITALGVPPQFRGRGHASALIAEVFRRSKADARSSGVAISTFARSRVELYERHGFRVVSHGSQSGIETWVLFSSHANMGR